MSASILAWAFAPTMPLIMLAYVGLALGTTFLSGAEDAFFYETLQVTGRAAEYTRLVGRAGATMLGASVLGSVMSGLLASTNLSPAIKVSGAVVVLVGILAQAGGFFLHMVIG